jgi:hypothetical protein
MVHTYLVICGGSSHINIIYHFLVLQLITLKIFHTKLAVKIRLCLHRGCIFVNNGGRKSATKHSAGCICGRLNRTCFVSPVDSLTKEGLMHFSSVMCVAEHLEPVASNFPFHYNLSTDFFACGGCF